MRVGARQFVAASIEPELGYNRELYNKLPYATFLFLSAAEAYIHIGCRVSSRRMRGIQLLRVLFALMYMALPSLQAKAPDAVYTPAMTLASVRPPPKCKWFSSFGIG